MGFFLALARCMLANAQPQAVSLTSRKSRSGRTSMNAKPSAVARADDPLPQAILAALGTAATPLARPFVEHFFSRIGSEDRSAHAADAWSGMMRGLLDFVRVRKAGTPNLRRSEEHTSEL